MPNHSDRGVTEALGLDRYALYIFDHGAPTGLRLAIRHPGRITAIISQNGNAYLEGFRDEWGAWQDYWGDPSNKNREAGRPSLSPETIRTWQYGTGAAKNRLSPDGHTLDIAYMARGGAEEIQLDLIGDYKTNVALYPASQTYFRPTSHPSLRSGEATTPLSSHRAPRPIAATCPKRKSICWMQDISL